MPSSFHSSGVRAGMVKWYTIFPLAFKIFQVLAGPMSIARPGSHPRTNCSLGKGMEVSQYTTHSDHLNKANREMSAVSPLTIVSGTWPLRPKISRAVWEWMYYNSLSKQWSQRHLGAPDRTISRLSPRFSSWMADSAAFDRGIWGSVCLTWAAACLHLQWNSPFWLLFHQVCMHPTILSQKDLSTFISPKWWLFWKQSISKQIVREMMIP